MTLKQAIREAWHLYKGLPYNSSETVVIYEDEDKDYSAVVLDENWWQEGKRQVIRVRAERWYDGDKKPVFMTLKEFTEKVNNSLKWRKVEDKVNEGLANELARGDY